MSRYVLDSDILSLLQHNHAAVRARFLAHTSDELCVAVVTVDEQLRGWYTLVRSAKKRDQLALAYANLAKSISFLSKATILPFDEATIDRFEQLKKLKLGIGSPDLRLAATALEVKAIAVTRNLRDFTAIPGLVVEDWSRL